MNYIGSKTSLLNFIEQTVESVAGQPPGLGQRKADKVFCDLFAGTGAVGSRFKELGYEVVANDIQYYSYILNRNAIENCADIADRAALSHLVEYLNDELEPSEGFIYSNYCKGSGSGRNYFSDENGKKCDAIRKEIERLHLQKAITEDDYFFLLAGLINSADKVANTATVYASFLKHIKKSAQKPLVLEPITPPHGIKGRAFCEDSHVLIRRISGDILYLDPPYNTRQYGSNYHILETIARYDEPKITGVTGLRDWTETKSAWCSKRTAKQALKDTIDNADFKYIFLSYNNEGLIAQDEIENLFAQNGRYLCYEQPYHRLITHAGEPPTTTTEYIHCLIRE